MIGYLKNACTVLLTPFALVALGLGFALIALSMPVLVELQKLTNPNG